MIFRTVVIVLLTMLFLIGCAAQPVCNPQIVERPVEVVRKEVPQELLTPCYWPKPRAQMSYDDVADYAAELIEAFRECEAKKTSYREMKKPIN